MLSDDGRVILVFNGEIYNFRELRSDLEARGHRFRGWSDTEVLLRLYLDARHGGQVVDIGALLRRLNGIFALALWDADRRAMLLARDAIGVKPLYFNQGPLGLHFASEIKALSIEESRLDYAALDRYLSFLWCPGEGTPMSSVRKLGPGQALWVSQGAITECITWYRLPVFRRDLISKAVVTEGQAIRGTEIRLRQAVHRQMVADVAVGAFLSGGLDSSSVVAFAREVSADIRCFTIEVVADETDGMAEDLPYARQVARHLGVPLEVVRVNASQMAADLPEMVAQLDEPLADPAPLNVLYISRLARERGIRVLLSGAGGDDLFTGYRRHRAVMFERTWRWLPHSLRVGLKSVTRGLDQRRPLFRRVTKLFSGASLDGEQRLVNYFRWVDRRDLQAIYSPAFRIALEGQRAEDPMIEFLSGLPTHTDPLERMLALEQRFFLADHNLLYTDKMSMAAGIETRVPFLDLELVEFAAQIPARFKQRGGEGKWVLKKAMERYLPRDVIYRPKTGFGLPLRRWMRVELRELLADVLSEKRLRDRGLFDPLEVQRLICANDEGAVDASYTLLSLLCIELWCRRFLDVESSSRPTRYGGANV
jgi:asparagine synthase (glutamine-hydrolysing)